MEAVSAEACVTPPLRSRTPTAKPVERGRIPIEEIDKLNGFTPRIQRLKQRYFESRSAIDGERAWWMVESLKQTTGEHPAKRRAKAFRNVLENMSIVIREDELLVGAMTRFLRGAVPCVEFAPRWIKGLLEQSRQTTSSPVTEAVLDEEDRSKLMAAADYYLENGYAAKRTDEIMDRVTDGMWAKICEARMAMRPTGAPILLACGADYDKIMEVGYNGFIQEAREHTERIRAQANGKGLSAEEHDKIEWLEAVIIVLEGMIHHAHRYAVLARELAGKEQDSQRKQELLNMADICEWVPANPPRTFHEALQTYWFTATGHDLEKAQANTFIARFDQYMWPFYARDINAGRITRQEAAELMGCLFMKWTGQEAFLFIGGNRSHQEIAQSNYFANVTLGGLTREGRDACNELSCLVLQVAKQVKTHQPHISIRYHRTMAPEFLEKAIECNRDHGAGIPAWFNDRVGTEYLLDRGVRWDDARDWAMAGCVNTLYPKSFGWVRPGVAPLVHHAKILEIALNNGTEPYTGHKIGIETGDPRNFRTFEEVIEAYRKQLDHFYELCLKSYYASEKTYYEDADYFPFISAFLQDCIQKGQDATRFGGRYQQLEAAVIVDRAVQDAADSLTAIKKVIFEDKKATMDQLLDALKKNFEGYGDLRQACLAAPKYGNDEDEPDDLTVQLWRYSVNKTQSYRDGYGRRFVLFRQGAAWSTWAGKTTGALPNGRKAGTSLADGSASPQQGCDVKGPTAAMNSVVKLDPMFMEGPLLNMKFAPGMLRKKEGRQKFAELLGTYFDKGGFHVQFNILDRETLLDAKQHPEKYRGLVVRVAGYSAFWVELSPAVQEEIISRTEQCL
ncbi:MAG: glycyl radical protein [Candidatus Binatia bacterium]